MNFLDAAYLACRTAFEKKGEEVVLLDITNVSVFADYFVVVTGRSSAHRKALAQAIKELLDDIPLVRRGIEGYPDSPWILLDYYGIVVHIFGAEERDYYALESRWPDGVPQKFEQGFVI